MELDAIVPAGGRASRLGGLAKPLLTIDGTSLLHRAVAAAGAGSRRVVVVGPDELEVPPGVLLTREDPPFGGPLAAIAAGLAALDLAATASGARPADWVLTLAADQPGVAGLTPVLLDRLHTARSGWDVPDAIVLDALIPDAIVGTDPGGRRQYLAACYRGDALREALARKGSGVAGGSMRQVVDGLGVIDVPLPADAVGDIDTWDDAARWGAQP